MANIIVPRHVPWRRKPLRGSAVPQPGALSGYLLLENGPNNDSYGSNDITTNTGVFEQGKLKFNGTNQRAELTNKALEGKSQFSIEWKGRLVGNVTADHPIYSERASSGPGAIFWFDDTAGGTGYPGAGNTDTISFDPGVSLFTENRVSAATGTAVSGAEYHIIATFLGSTRVALYNFGKLLVEKTSDIGASAATSGEKFIAFSGVLNAYGNIETEFLIFWDHALSDSEIDARRTYPYANIYTPRRRYIPISTGAGGAAEFDASISASGTVSADLSTEINLASSLNAIGSTQVDLTTQITLDSAVSAQGTVQPDLTTAIEMASSATADGLVSADIETQILFGSAVTAAGTVTADLETAIEMAASINASGAVDAQLEGTGAQFSTSVSADGTVSADIETQITFASAISGAATVAADLDTQITFATAVNAQGTVSAEMEAAGAEFDTSVSASGSISADLLTEILMQAAVNADGTVSSELLTEIAFAAGVNAQAVISAALSVGVVVINTSAKETLALAAENPTLTLTTETAILTLS